MSATYAAAMSLASARAAGSLMNPNPGSQAARTRKLERIIEISRILTSTLELDPLLQLIIETASELTESEAASIMLLDPTSGELRFEAAPWFQRDQLKTVAVPLDKSIAGWIFCNAAPLVIADAKNDPRVYRQVDQSIEFETRSILGVPLMLKDKPIGVIEAVNKLGRGRYTQEDTEVLSTLAAQAAVALENARLLTALQKAYDELSQLDKLKSNFIAIASHELRTPLGLILGHATFLRDGAAPDSAEQLDVVVRSALRLKSIIEDLANLGHIEQGEASLSRSNFGVDEVIREAVDEALPLAEAKQLSLRMQTPPQRVSLHADRDKIRTALTNLLNNAIKFTPAGGRVLISAQAMNTQVKVSVIDTGIGIPAEHLEKIFDRFYQVESHLTRRHGGMGLGLSIARVMIELHGGRIWAESVEGKGSSFSFLLPLAGPKKTAPFTQPA